MTPEAPSPTTARPTTIVVPAYGDLPSLEASILSVLAHGDLGRNRLLVVNDIGPEADVIEARVLELLDGVDSTEYVRNPSNLGFARTCNRAVLELDTSSNDVLLLNSDAELTAGALEEMTGVLYAAEKHGVVCPRSNNATIATVPFMARDRGDRTDLVHSRSTFDAISPELPRYSVSPVAVGFCFLVKRSLIANYGLFDEIYSPGYSEENDFCLRINAHGYSSLIANHAYVVHEGSKSFTASSFNALKLREEHEAIMIGRYPFYLDAVRHYLESEIDPVDWFSDFVGANGFGTPRRVLIDLHHLSLAYDGSVRNALSFLTLLAARAAEPRFADVEFVVASSKEAIRFFDLPGYGFRTIVNDEVSEVFDLGFALAPVTDQAQIQRLSRWCARWVLTHLDIIAARILPLLENDYARKQVILDSLRFADRVVVISEATKADTLAYYPGLPEAAIDRMTVVHQGAAQGDTLEAKQTGSGFTERQRAALAAGDYVLAIGNTFPHKQLPETIEALRGYDRTVVVFGSRDEDLGDNIVPVRGGLLSDAEVSRLYDQAGLVLYPSAYEGYGLPIAEAARHGKPVVLFDTAIAREVVAELGTEASVRYFTTFSALRGVLDEAWAAAHDAGASAVPSKPLRSLDEYNSALLDVILDELAKPVDLVKLRARVQHFRAIGAYLDRPVQQLAATRHHLAQVLARRSFRVIDTLIVRMSWLRPVARGANAVRRKITP